MTDTNLESKTDRIMRDVPGNVHTLTLANYPGALGHRDLDIKVGGEEIPGKGIFPGLTDSQVIHAQGGYFSNAVVDFPDYLGPNTHLQVILHAGSEEGGNSELRKLPSPYAHSIFLILNEIGTNNAEALVDNGNPRPKNPFLDVSRGHLDDIKTLEEGLASGSFDEVNLEGLAETSYHPHVTRITVEQTRKYYVWTFETYGSTANLNIITRKIEEAYALDRVKNDSEEAYRNLFKEILSKARKESNGMKIGGAGFVTIQGIMSGMGMDMRKHLTYTVLSHEINGSIYPVTLGCPLVMVSRPIPLPEGIETYENKGRRHISCVRTVLKIPKDALHDPESRVKKHTTRITTNLEREKVLRNIVFKLVDAYDKERREEIDKVMDKGWLRLIKERLYYNIRHGITNTPIGEGVPAFMSSDEVSRFLGSFAAPRILIVGDHEDFRKHLSERYGHVRMLNPISPHMSKEDDLSRPLELLDFGWIPSNGHYDLVIVPDIQRMTITDPLQNLSNVIKVMSPGGLLYADTTWNVDQYRDHIESLLTPKFDHEELGDLSKTHHGLIVGRSEREGIIKIVDEFRESINPVVNAAVAIYSYSSMMWSALEEKFEGFVAEAGLDPVRTRMEGKVIIAYKKHK